MDLSFYKGKKVLVTGHTVFKGSWLCRILFKAGAEVTGYSLVPPTEPNLFSMVMFGNGKIKEADAAYHWGYWANNELAIGKNVVEVKDGEKKRGDTASEGWEK